MVWPYLQGKKNLHVIHVKRRNSLKRLLSRSIGRRTQRWLNTDGKEENQKPIQLSYKECLNEFTQARVLESKYDEFFKTSAVIEIWYEDLELDFTKEMTKIQHFLGISIANLAPLTYKQNRLSLSQAISNYEELKERFQGTSWATFFEE